MENNQFTTSWQLQNHIIDMVEQSIIKGNKLLTLTRKLRIIFRDNPKLFKHVDSLSIWEGSHIKLLRKSRCFDFMKSGFFKPQHEEWLIKISTITKINAYVDETYEVESSTKDIKKISEQDYFDLKTLIH